jgi:ATP-dependent RNA helicase DeaD
VAITLVDPREQRLLRNIESSTKQTIEVATLPTIAALKAKRFDAMRAALQQRVVAGDLEELRALAQSLAEDFDPLDVAAAAIALMQTETDAKSAARSSVDISAPPPARPEERKPARSARPSGLRLPPGGIVHLAINVGQQNGVRPGDIVGAITGEARITSRELGAIRIGPSESLIEVPATLAPRIAKSLRGKWIRSQKLAVRIEAR